MNEQSVREHAQAHCDALLAGDVGRAALEMSRELQAHLGPLVAMLPLPLTEATVDSVEMTGTAYLCVLHLVGDGGSLLAADALERARWAANHGRGQPPAGITGCAANAGRCSGGPRGLRSGSHEASARSSAYTASTSTGAPCLVNHSPTLATSR